jgi:UDP-N-acetylmuramate dehydrogenase
MAQEYASGKIQLLSFEEYCEAAALFISELRGEVAVERVSGEAPSDLLIAPDWCGEREKIKKYLNLVPPMPSLENEPLSRHTTMRVGGPARRFATPSSVEEMQEIISGCQKRGEPYMVLGKGSNVIFNDTGFDGTVICIGKNWSKIEVKENKITAQSGASLAAVAQAAVRAGLAGMECLAGIPGTVGGACVMNAGAHGQQISDTVESVLVGAPLRGRPTQQYPKQYKNPQCQFGYRKSIFQNSTDIILEVDFTFKLTESISVLQKRMRECLAWRKEKQPLEWPNSGSMFKNPPGDSAGRLIESCGLKGFAVGGAQVSLKHANFVVNTGGASASDVWKLTERVIQMVQKETGIELQREVVFVCPPS